VQDFCHPEGLGRFTDDTQMTLFTAEALLLHGAAQEPLLLSLHKAYLRWLATQQVPSRIAPEHYTDAGFLCHAEILYRRMGPGRTCILALMHAPDLGMPVVNGSKGCGGLMRVAPIGLWAALHADTWDPRRTFTVASQAAQLTHGDPCGYLSAGAFALLLRDVVLGTPLEEALEKLLAFLVSLGPFTEALRQPLQVVQTLHQRQAPWEAAVAQLGAGWVAEEILAIAVYLGLRAPDYRTGVLWAANHPGDTDSVGAIAGQLLGTLWGMAKIPTDWVQRLEGSALVDAVVSEMLSGTGL